MIKRNKRRFNRSLTKIHQSTKYQTLGFQASVLLGLPHWQYLRDALLLLHKGSSWPVFLSLLERYDADNFLSQFCVSV
jgi:hypothetical protein